MLKKWLAIGFFLFLLLRIPVADFLAYTNEQKQELLQASAQAFFEMNPDCEEAIMVGVRNGEFIYIGGECVSAEKGEEI